MSKTNIPFDQNLLPAFSLFIAGIAKKKREEAGYAGEYGDRGASELMRNLETFCAGLNCEIPMSLSTVWSEFMKTQDVEFAEFLEMKKKMEARYGKIE